MGRTWPATSTAGWDDPSVARIQKDHWPFLAEATLATGPLGVSHFPWRNTADDPADQNVVMSFGYVLAKTARGKDRISMLDWGGGLGHYRLYAQALLPAVTLDYHCFDLPAMCKAGQEVQPQARFISDESELADRQFDLVVSSSSLHYSPDWRATLKRLTQASGEYLYVARLQTVADKESFVVKQTPRLAGYRSSYFSWFINRSEFRSCVEDCSFVLEREFVFDERWWVPHAPEQGRSWGFLLRSPQQGRQPA